MDYLLDTNAVSDLMREHPGVMARAGRLTEADRMVLCPIVRGETAYGIQRLPIGKRRAELEEKVAKVLRAMAPEPVPSAAGDKYASVKIARQRLGLALDENDLWIAATAVTLGATLVSRDTDFRHIEGLRLEDWTT